MLSFSVSRKENESYFVTKKNNNSLIISDKSPAQINAGTSPKMKSPSTPVEWSIFDNSRLTRKKQPSKTPTPVTTKTPAYKAKKVSRKHLFSDDLLLREEIIFLRKELDNKQRIIETLLQQISGNVRLTHQLENTNFNNVINKDVNIKPSQDKSSKYQSPSKLINDINMEKSALT